MKNRIKLSLKIIVIFIGVIMFIFAPKIVCKEEMKNSQTENEVVTEEFATENNEIKETQTNDSEDKPTYTFNELEIFMNDEIANLNHNYNILEERMGWFIEYKEVIKKYPPELHKETIYERYSQEELDLLFRIVQAEVGDYGFIETSNVVSVIFNRVHINQSSLMEILTQEEQFSSYLDGRYKDVIIDEETILACEYVHIFGDTTFGCIAYRSHKKCPEKWFGWTKQFSDEAHCFYKGDLWIEN